MSEKDKLKEYLRIKGITKNAFCKVLGFSDRFLDSGNSLGVDKLRRIKQHYPDLSLEWIVLGEGSMMDHENQLLREALKLKESGLDMAYVYEQMKRLEVLKNRADTDSEMIKLADELLEKLVLLSKKQAELIGFIKKEF